MNKFMDSNVESKSAKKSYVTLFKRINEYEDLTNKGIEDWSKDDCLDFLSNIGSKKYNTVAVKWSLLKKYLIYINNPTYRYINKEDLENIESNSLEYIPYDKVINSVEIFKNNIDKALILLLRNGVKGENFEELYNLKISDINGNVIKLENREVELDDYTSNIIHLAMGERGYRMNIGVDKVATYDYYAYNKDSEYLWKNRPNKFNNYGLDPIKKNASVDKINKLLRRIGDDNLSSSSLALSYVIDRIMEFENEMDMILTEKQVASFINKIGVRINMYTVYTIKNSMRKNVNNVKF